ncbi:TetR/AcrR family transcriptional regulator [Williamsia herbipolensis]|uniref:TetR/AcrR family transcriptional regulator n=1 Tax=Williamsia herbipolensis TaxID=1603258 RepID=UPI0005F7EB5A|nr:TetR/AcrR family transcriptional regulator [Williamsia herbipolensis]
MPMRKSSEQKLLDAVDDLLFTRGIESTPVDAVLARAGVSAATLYRGFRSKEALVAAALERRHSRWRDEWERAIDAAPDAEGRVLAVFDALEAFRDRTDSARWCAFLGAAAEYSSPPDELAEAIGRDTDHFRTRLHQLITDAGCTESAELTEEILLVISGELAMRLREPKGSAGTGRRIATALVRASLPAVP